MLAAGTLSVGEQVDRTYTVAVRAKHEPHSSGPLLECAQWDDSQRPLCRAEARMGHSRRQPAHGTDSRKSRKLQKPFELRLSNNALNGSIPLGLLGLPNISMVEILMNEVMGPIPSQIIDSRSSATSLLQQPLQHAPGKHRQPP